jgi:hypothetical protein
MEQTTTAAVCIENMLTAAVLLALGLVDNVTGSCIGGSRRVRLEVECDQVRLAEVRQMAAKCNGGLDGIMVDVGKYQGAFRQVSRVIDEARDGANKERIVL